MRLLVWIFLSVLLVRCTTTDSSASAVAGASWYGTMHKLSVNHSAIVPIVADPNEFYNPKNLPLLREKNNAMMMASVELTKDTTAPNADPIIDFVAKEFSQDLKGVSEMLDTGKLQPAHYSLSQVGNYCISCHSRADRGSKNFPLAWATNLTNLAPSQKVIFYLANRQYETAHQETEKIIKDEALLRQDPNSWMLLVQKDLAVMIRVQQDLPRAQKLIGLVLKNKNLPEYMKQDVQAWAESLKGWGKEEKRTIEGKKNLTFVKRILDLARTPQYSQRQAGFVLYLRASGILHELLEASRNEAGYPSVLYFAGVTADALKNVDVWKLGAHYFEVCIENAPNTVVSQKCYQQLEHLEYSSRPNLNLMPELAKRIENRLARFKDLSRLPIEMRLPGKARSNMLDGY